MTRPRHLARGLNRNLLRYSTRMLGGFRRPPPPNFLRIACRALAEVLRIDQRLGPYVQEQIRLEQQRRFEAVIEAALDRVYGPDRP